MAADKPELSLIICSRNRSQALEQCLRALPQGAAAAAHAELVLVDSDSNDDTLKILERYRRDARFPVKVTRAERPGLGRARNAGIAVSAADIVCFTDDDCYLTERYFEQMAAHFTNSDLDYCGGRIFLYDKTDAMIAVDYDPRFRLIPAYSAIRPGTIQGANMAFRRGAIEAVGGFNDSLGAGMRFRCEDIEFVARLSWHGFVGAHVPDPIIFHHHQRKPGAELVALERHNDLAAGAFYAMMIGAGHFRYFPFWLKTSLRTRLREKTFGAAMRCFYQEVEGALGYFAAGHKGS